MRHADVLRGGAKDLKLPSNEAVHVRQKVPVFGNGQQHARIGRRWTRLRGGIGQCLGRVLGRALQSEDAFLAPTSPFGRVLLLRIGRMLLLLGRLLLGGQGGIDRTVAAASRTAPRRGQIVRVGIPLVQTLPHAPEKHLLRTARQSSHLLGVCVLEARQGVLDLGRALGALEDMGRDLSKTVGQTVDSTPKELARLRGPLTMPALKASEPELDFLALATSRLAVRFSETDNPQLPHEVKEKVGEEDLIFVADQSQFRRFRRRVARQSLLLGGRQKVNGALRRFVEGRTAVLWMERVLHGLVLVVVVVELLLLSHWPGRRRSMLQHGRGRQTPVERLRFHPTRSRRRRSRVVVVVVRWIGCRAFPGRMSRR